MPMTAAGLFAPWNAKGCMVTMRAIDAENAETQHVRSEIIV